MPAPKGNKNAAKSVDELLALAPLYIEHIANGFSKESFVEADYRTIEKYVESDVVLRPLKSELEKAHRASLKYWEQVGKDITTGKIRGNPATWIFTIKNKFPELYKDRQEIAHDIHNPEEDKRLIEEINKIKTIIKGEAESR